MDRTVVKTEKEDQEILDLAAKMIEANKLKMMHAQNNPVPTGQMQSLNGQQTTCHYTGNHVRNMASSPVKKTVPQLDEESIMGKFGWTCFGKDLFFPFIYRLGEKYCAVRMVEACLLSKYLPYLPSDIYKCTCIRSYYITDNEARLLNEINSKHCDLYFGKQSFTTADFVVRLQDAEHFFQFLEMCYKKLVLKKSDECDPCGFFRINGESVVPYTTKEGIKYVPLFYFEGETDNLMQKVQQVEGWELAYLKFCCKVQGIKNELFALESCLVVSLEDIKKHFPESTVFEEWWPTKSLVNPKLLPPTSCNSSVNNLPCVPDYGLECRNSSLFSAPAATQPGLTSGNVVSAFQFSSCPSQMVTSSAAVVPSKISAHLPPLVKVAPHVVSIDNMLNGTLNLKTTVIPNTLQQNKINRCTPITYGKMKRPLNTQYSLPNNHFPYQLQKVHVQGKNLLCINQNPFEYGQSLLLKFDDLTQIFFPKCNRQVCQEALNTLGIPLLKSNK